VELPILAWRITKAPTAPAGDHGRSLVHRAVGRVASYTPVDVQLRPRIAGFWVSHPMLTAMVSARDQLAHVEKAACHSMSG